MHSRLGRGGFDARQLVSVVALRPACFGSVGTAVLGADCMTTNVEVDMFERIGKLVEQRDELLAALKLCAYRLEMARQELLILNEDNPNDVQNEAADEADKQAVALANAAIAKADARQP